MPQAAGTSNPQGAEGFVGRSRERSVLSAALDQAAAGDARLALISGEPGIGKTELARVFVRSAVSGGALVLWGSAWEDGGAPPYWPWVQVLRSYARQAGAQALADAAGPRAAVLGQFLPELGPVRDPAGSDPAGSEPAGSDLTGSGPGARLALFEAVGAVLDQVSRAVPLAVILDDLHAAGRPSALLLRFAATARLSRVLLLATYRTAEAALDPDVSDVIAALESVSPPLVLAGLSAEDIRVMLPGADAGVVAAVQRRSEGNPLFVSQVARLLGPGAAAVEEVPVPAGIRQAVRRQVARLGRPETATEPGDGTPAAEEILATAAALGPGIDPALVAAALDAPAGLVTRLCDDATAIGLLGPGHDVGEVYRFRHALIRETLYAELAPQARAQAHHRIAAVLENAVLSNTVLSNTVLSNLSNTAGRSHAELAYHFLRAAPVSAEAAARAAHHSRLAGQAALTALAWEEAAGHFRRALDVQRRAAQATPASRAGLLLSLAEALTKTGPDPAASQAIDEAVRLARHADAPRLLAAAALLNAQHLDFNAPADTATSLLREAAAALDPADHALRARTLARLAITLAAEPSAARADADHAVQDARAAVTQEPDGRAAAAALATALAARHYVLWGSQDPADALAAADEIVTAAQQAREPEAELDGRVLRLTHLLELGDGPAAQQVLPELDRLAGALRQPAVRLTALSRRSTLAALTGDFGTAAEFARRAFDTGQAASLPDAGAVYWGQLFAIWLHADLPGDEQWMERELRDLVARSHRSVAHAAALVQIEAARGPVEQARGRLDELLSTGLDTLRPDMVFVWALAMLARGCVVLRAARHAPRLYQALAPYAGRAVVCAGAVMCAGSTDFYLAGLAALSGDTAAADRHYRAAASIHRRLGARPMLAHTLHEHALLLRRQENHPAATAALAEAGAIAADCGMTKLLAVLGRPRQHDKHDQPRGTGSGLSLAQEDDFWLVGFADAVTRVPDSLGLRYLDLLIRHPGRELTALELVQAVAATGAARASTGGATAADGLHDASGAPADYVIDQQARTAYRQRLAALDEDLAEAEQWNDTERASRLRAEKDFLVHELAAATGLGGRPRRLGAESERARLNVTRAIRSAIVRIRDRAPAAAVHLDQAVRTGTRCSYSPPDG